MTKVVVDETLRAKLGNLHEPIELCDATGRTLGHYLPAHDHAESLSAKYEPRFSP
jgi:hypothetical protein